MDIKPFEYKHTKDMKLKKIIALFGSAGLLFTGCLKGEFSYTNYAAFAEVTDATTLSGDGDVTYRISENASGIDLSTVEKGTRYYIICDLLNAVDSNGGCDIKLTSATPVTVKTCLKGTDAAVPTLKADSLYIAKYNYANAFYLTANGDNTYLTVLVSIPTIKDSTTEHDLDLVMDSGSTSSNVTFTLYHNANEDVFTPETKDDDKTYEVRYASFRVRKLLNEIGVNNSTEIKLESAFDKKSENKD